MESRRTGINIVLLIELVEHKTYLYDKLNKYFKDDRMKQAAFEEIDKILNITAEQCRKIWKNLRDRYTREKKTIVEHSGMEYNDRNCWPYMKSMAFLALHVRPRSTYSATSCYSSASTHVLETADPLYAEVVDNNEDFFEDLVETSLEESQRNLQIVFEEDTDTQSSNQPESVASAIVPTATPKQQRSKNNAKIANQLVEVARDIASNIQSSATSRPSTDDAFGQYVAQRLMELESEQRSEKRRKIVLILEDI